jgi:hypothetical protein
LADDGPFDCIWEKPGNRSPETAGRGVGWELYHGSTGPREWTCEIDGSSSFAATANLEQKAAVLTVGGEEILGENGPDR